MMVQVTFIDRNTAESWTVTHDFDFLDDAIEYLLERPPQNVGVKDTYLAHIMVADGMNLYFKGYQGLWELINSSDYNHTHQHDYQEALKAKNRKDELQAKGCVKRVEPLTAQGKARLAKALVAAEDGPRRRKERYKVC